MKLVARLILAAFVAGTVTWLARVDYARKISTDVLDLVPADEREPELMLARRLASEQHARVALFALHAPGGGAADAAGIFVGELRRSPAFAEVRPANDTPTRDALGRFVFERRFDYLLPGWLAERHAEYEATAGADPFAPWLAERTVENLERFLARPDALAFEPLLPADPLLLVPTLIESVQDLDDTRATTSDGDKLALIWTRLAASPLAEAGQEPVFAAVRSAFAVMQERFPEAHLQWTAISRFAAESKRRIKTEVSVLNIASFAAVLAVAAVGLQRMWQVAHLVPVVLCSLLGAWTVTTLAVPRVHVLVFVIGSLLAGIAIDYGLHVFLHVGQAGESFRQRVAALLRPLAGSAATTIAGFSVLLISDLPLIRHIGIFVCAGLVCAIAATLLWFAQIREPEAGTRALLRRTWSGGFRFRGGVALVVLAAAGVGLLRLQWHDDIRELDIRSPALWENDRAVRALFGQTTGRRLFLATGDSVPAARSSLARFRAWLMQTHPDATAASAGFILPTEEALRALPVRLTELASFTDELRVALERHGFEPDAFRPFFRSWDEASRRDAWPAFAPLTHDFTNELHGPLSMLLDVDAARPWFAIAVDAAADIAPPADLPVVGIDQLETLNHLFWRYRLSALRLGLVGLAVAATGVVVLYGPRRGGRMFLVPLGACVGAFGILGLAGQTLNLFHLLGAFLAVCLCFDYAIFAGDSRSRHTRGLPPSIRLSAGTTIASFGVLAFSNIPVVSALGTTVALVVGAALAIIEFAGATPHASDQAAST